MRPRRDILALTVRRGFWASEVSRSMFPRTMYAGGPGSDVVWWRNAWLLLRALPSLIFRRPKLVVVGPAHKVAKWLLWLRHRGLFRGFKLVTQQMVCYWTGLAPYADRIICFGGSEVAYFGDQVGNRKLYKFIHFPVEGDFDLSATPYAPAYIFAGGSGRRDFESLVEAARGLPVRVLIRGARREAVNCTDPLPENVEIGGPVPLRQFLQEIKDSLFTVVPLVETPLPTGHTSVGEAMRLGKAVISTRRATVDEYIADGVDGVLVDPYDVAGYRRAMLELLNDAEKLRRIEEKALEKSRLFTYENYALQLAGVCDELLGERKSGDE